jgi:hypothetical protein
MEMVEMDVPEFGGTPAERLYQDMRYTGNTGKVHMVTAPDVTDGFLRRYELQWLHE